MRVEQLMSKDVTPCAPDDSLNEVARILWERDCGCVPVVAASDGGRVVAMITDRDICMAVQHDRPAAGRAAGPGSDVADPAQLPARRRRQRRRGGHAQPPGAPAAGRGRRRMSGRDRLARRSRPRRPGPARQEGAGDRRDGGRPAARVDLGPARVGERAPPPRRRAPAITASTEKPGRRPARGRSGADHDSPASRPARSRPRTLPGGRPAPRAGARAAIDARTRATRRPRRNSALAGTCTTSSAFPRRCAPRPDSRRRGAGGRDEIADHVDALLLDAERRDLGEARGSTSRTRARAAASPPQSSIEHPRRPAGPARRRPRARRPRSRCAGIPELEQRRAGRDDALALLEHAQHVAADRASARRCTARLPLQASPTAAPAGSARRAASSAARAASTS